MNNTQPFKRFFELLEKEESFQRKHRSEISYKDKLRLYKQAREEAKQGYV